MTHWMPVFAAMTNERAVLIRNLGSKMLGECGVKLNGAYQSPLKLAAGLTDTTVITVRARPWRARSCKQPSLNLPSTTRAWPAS